MPFPHARMFVASRARYKSATRPRAERLWTLRPRPGRLALGGDQLDELRVVSEGFEVVVPARELLERLPLGDGVGEGREGRLPVTEQGRHAGDVVEQVGVARIRLEPALGRLERGRVVP